MRPSGSGRGVRDGGRRAGEGGPPRGLVLMLWDVGLGQVFDRVSVGIPTAGQTGLGWILGW